MAFLVDVPAGTGWYIDSPGDPTAGINFYQVSATDTGGNEGQRSAEVCFDPG